MSYLEAHTYTLRCDARWLCRSTLTNITGRANTAQLRGPGHSVLPTRCISGETQHRQRSESTRQYTAVTGPHVCGRLDSMVSSCLDHTPQTGRPHRHDSCVVLDMRACPDPTQARSSSCSRHSVIEQRPQSTIWGGTRAPLYNATAVVNNHKSTMCQCRDAGMLTCALLLQHGPTQTVCTGGSRT